MKCRKSLANCFGFALSHSVIGSKFSRHFLNQSEVRPKPIVASTVTKAGLGVTPILLRAQLATTGVRLINGNRLLPTL